MSKSHELKTIDTYFYRVFTGQKTFEVRKNDRDFQIGDLLILNEIDGSTMEPTGRTVFRKIDYILHGGQFGIQEGYCVMSLKIEKL